MEVERVGDAAWRAERNVSYIEAESQLWHVVFTGETELRVMEGSAIIVAATPEEAEDLAHDHFCFEFSLDEKDVVSFVVDSIEPVPILGREGVLSAWMWELDYDATVSE